jgi:lysozyme family protein
MANFLEAFQNTMGFEGGYVCDRDDRGGETYRGISRIYNADWEGWNTIDRLKGQPDFPRCLDGIGALQEAIKRFYKQHYWDRFQGDVMASQEIAEELFDTGVNLGVTKAVTFLQTALNLLNSGQKLYPDIVEDGLCGPKTLEALSKYLQSEPAEYLITIANILQGMHYITLMKQRPAQEKYARGWLKRVALGGRSHA